MSFERGKWLVGEKYSPTSIISWKFSISQKSKAYSLIKKIIDKDHISQYYIGYSIYINGICINIRTVEEVKICIFIKKIAKVIKNRRIFI